MSDNRVLENIRRSLGGNRAALLTRPEVLPPREAGTTEQEVELFLKEVRRLSGTAERMTAEALPAALEALVRENQVRRAALWDTPFLNKMGLEAKLRRLGVEAAPPRADKHELARCDLGITEADYLLPETGTLVLRSSAERPRAASLLPGIHLALVRPEMLRADLQQVFAEARDSGYLVFISGPSRTADIELNVTLGVHGPMKLVVWMMGE